MDNLMEYFKDAVRDYAAAPQSSDKFLAAFFALVDAAMSGEETGVLFRKEDGALLASPFEGETSSGEKICDIFPEGAEFPLSYGLYLEKLPLKEIISYCAEKNCGLLTVLSGGTHYLLVADNVKTLAEHVFSPIAPIDAE